MSGEFAAIARLRRLFPEPPAGETWIGDDAAVLGSGLLVAADLVVEGTHFGPSTPRADVGWKAVAVNVSDIAAMGGRPTHLLVTVAGPPSTDLDGLYEGIAAASAVYGCPVVGGDLANGDVLSISVTVLGKVPKGGAVLRSGAKAGHELRITGPVGAAAASGYTLRPEARLDEGEAARKAGATAMIDVSDGLAADLNHLAEASGVGIKLDRVPIAEGATLEQALGGGEDYELVFAIPRSAAKTKKVPGTVIGVCTKDPADRLPDAGWQHSWR